MTHLTRSPLALLLLMLIGGALPAAAQNETRQFSAKNGAFTFKAPAAFKDIPDAPKDSLVALEVPGFGVSFLAQREKAEDVEIDKALGQAKKKVTEGGATVIGTAKADLASKPAFSMLIGGVRKDRESLFVYNLRSDFWYVFVLNYPTGQRKDAADLWKMIAPTIRFNA